jgi:hypothetical protein
MCLSVLPGKKRCKSPESSIPRQTSGRKNDFTVLITGRLACPSGGDVAVGLVQRFAGTIIEGNLATSVQKDFDVRIEAPGLVR